MGSLHSKYRNKKAFSNQSPTKERKYTLQQRFRDSLLPRRLRHAKELSNACEITLETLIESSKIQLQLLPTIKSSKDNNDCDTVIENSTSSFPRVYPTNQCSLTISTLDKCQAVQFIVCIDHFKLHLASGKVKRNIRLEIDFDGTAYASDNGKCRIARLSTQRFEEVEAESSETEEEKHRFSSSSLLSNFGGNNEIIVEWHDDKFQFQYITDEIDVLNAKDLSIIVFDQSKSEPLGSLHIPLLEICCGPKKIRRRLHASQSISPHQLSCRCSMEIIRTWTFQIQSLKCHLDLENQHPALRSCYKFTMQQNFVILCSYKRADGTMVSFMPQTKKSRDALEWTEEELCRIQDHTTFQQVSTSFLHVQLYQWTDSSMFQEEHLQDTIPEDINHVLYAECWIPFSKLLGSVSSLIDPISSNHHENIKNPPNIQLESIIDTYLWLRGKLIGKLQGIVQFYQVPESTQLLSGWNSDEGIVAATPLIDNLMKQVKPFFISRFNCWNNNNNIMNHNNKRNLKSKLNNILSDPDEPIKQNFFSSFFLSTTAPIVLSKELKKLIQSYQKLQILLSKIHNEHLILTLSSKIKLLLHWTCKKWTLSFHYSNLHALQIGRQILIDLAKTLLYFLDIMNHDAKCQFYEIIFLILRRGELCDPTSFHFSSLPKMNDVSFQDQQSIQKEVNIGLNYRKLLYQVYAYAIRKLNIKESFDELRVFCMQMIVIAFFRIPDCRPLIIDAILPMDETENIHWKNMKIPLTPDGKHFEVPEVADLHMEHNNPSSPFSFSNNNNNTPKQQLNNNPIYYEKLKRHHPFIRSNHMTATEDPVLKCLDWNDFHQDLLYIIETIPKKSLHIKFLSMYQQHATLVPDKFIWIQRLKKHGHFFFLFGIEYIYYLIDTALGSCYDNQKQITTIEWRGIPGYSSILKAFILEMKRFPVAKYPESLKKLSLLMVSTNTQLMHCSIKIILAHINIYDVQSVADGIGLIVELIQDYQQWKYQLILYNFRIAKTIEPPKEINCLLNEYIDMDFFCEAMHILLESENAQILLNTLKCLYDIWLYLPKIGQEQLNHLIMKRHFFYLFTHWSWMVRHFFHHLLTFYLIKDLKNLSILQPKETTHDSTEIHEYQPYFDFLYILRKTYNPIIDDPIPKEKIYRVPTHPRFKNLSTTSVGISHDGLTFWDKNKLRHTLQQCYPKNLFMDEFVHVDLPCFQNIYVLDSCRKFHDMIVKALQNDMNKPELEWTTIILEDNQNEPIEEAFWN